MHEFLIHAGNQLGLGWQWGTLCIAFEVAAVWLGYTLIIHILFAWRMHRYGCSSMRRWSTLRILIPQRERNFIGGERIISWMKPRLALVTIAVVILTCWRVYVTHKAGEASRSGALVSIAALFVALKGFSELKRLEQIWDMTLLSAADDAHAKSVTDLGKAVVQSAERSVQWVSFFIALIGTVIWAYGDQVTSCGIFPYNGLQTDPDVPCFKCPQ